MLLQIRKAWNPDASRARLKDWQPFFFALGLVIVLAFWFCSRVYLFYNFSPMHHATARVFQDMSISMDEGRPFGDINVSRIIRNKDQAVQPDQPYQKAVQTGDEHCQFKALDPGLVGVFSIARHVFFLMPDSQLRVIMLQLLFDALLVMFLYFTFYRWGWLAAVFGAMLYSSHSVFALSMATAWYHFWDGLTATLSVLLLLWIYRLAKDRPPRKIALILLSILLGAVLGCGVWIRSSWFIFSPLILLAAAFSKDMRRWLIYAAVVYAIFAAGMVWQATRANGSLSYSTRMSWHTAFQALGRYPNPYGFEDDDLYVFERTHMEYGTNYNFCDYSEQDKTIKQDYMRLWHEDPGYIVQSISQRMFNSIFANFSDQYLHFWNHEAFFVAWLGVMLGLIVGGDLQFLVLTSAFLYILMNVCYSLVYYIHREYSYPTQMMVIFGATACLAGITTCLKRWWTGTWPPRPAGEKVHPAAIGFLISAVVMTFLFLPPVQHYLASNEAISYKWDQPAGLYQSAYLDLLRRADDLPPALHARFITYLKSHTTQKAEGPDEPLFQFVMQYLRHASYQNVDGSKHIFWFYRSRESDTYESLTRATKSIAGVGYIWLEGFDPAQPGSWDGNELRFKLYPDPLLPQDQLDNLLIKKFAKWNWRLRDLGGGEYVANYTGSHCTETQKQLAKYFNRQCGDPDETRSDDNLTNDNH